MAQEKIYPKGVIIFEPKQGAASYVKGTIAITGNEFFQWMKDHAKYASDYKGEKQMKFNLMESRDGKLYLSLDTYAYDKAQGGSTPSNNNSAGTAGGKDDLPF